MICTLCDSPGRMWLTVGGDEYGPACEAHSIELWEAYLDYVSGVPRPFDNSPAERELNRLIRDRSWTEEAKRYEEKAQKMTVAELVDAMSKMK